MPGFNFFLPFKEFPFFKCIQGIFAVLLMGVSCAYADEEELNRDQARHECFKGKTIYCLALGFAEEQAGQDNRLRYVLLNTINR